MIIGICGKSESGKSTLAKQNFENVEVAEENKKLVLRR